MAEIIQFGDFKVNVRERLVQRADDLIALTPKAFDVLAFLAGRPGQLILKAELLAAVWPDVVVSDSTLKRTVSDLRTALGDGQDGVRLIETVPKFGYRFVGGPHTATEEPASETQPVPDVPARKRRVRFRSAKLLAAVAGMALLGVLGAAVWRGKFREPPVRSVAVLPFHMEGPERDEVAEAGIADTLVTQLSQIRNLEVRSIGAVSRYTGPDRDPVRAGRELQTDAVLEGTLHSVSGRWRVNLRLLSSRDGKARWTTSFDERSQDLLSLEDAIAERVYMAISAVVGGEYRRESHRGTMDAEAYRLYLEGRYLFGKRTEEGFGQSVQKFEQSIARDPNYADAHASLAEAILIRSGYGAMAQGSVMARVREEAGKAVALDPGLADPHRVLGLLAENYDYNRRAAESEYRRALEVAPNDAATHDYFGEFLGLTGRFDEAEREMRLAARLDPLSPVVQTDWAKVAMLARNYDVALERTQRVLDLNPAFPNVYTIRELVFAFTGRPEKSLAAQQEGVRLYGLKDHALGFSFVAATAARTWDAARYLAEAEEQQKTGMRWTAGISYARTVAWMNQPDRAIDLIEKTLRTHEAPGIVGLEVEPGWDPLRGHPRFQAAAEGNGCYGAGSGPPCRREDQNRAERRRLVSHASHPGNHALVSRGNRHFHAHEQHPSAPSAL
ncbi:MAG: hypothetical protein C5B51_12045 [Terriglobia bacterium]|nr:MAG: hypothetical protein C5B51_12045 [Terriglobia bacterium]